MARIKIEVTAGDIMRGTPASCDLCPVARAIRRVLAHTYIPSVSANSITVKQRVEGFTSTLCVIFTPTKVSTFIGKFDHKQSGLKPFTFTINIPKEYLRNAD